MGTNGYNGVSCSAEADRVCGPCKEGTWNDGNYLTCQACSANCGDGMGVNGEKGEVCSRTHDIICKPCLFGTFNDGSALDCKGACPVGTGINGCADCGSEVKIPLPNGGEIHFEICRACPTGTFNTGNSFLCKTCRTKCPVGTGISDYDGSFVQDGQCVPAQDYSCYTCPQGTYNEGDFLACRGCSGSCDRGLGIDPQLGGDKCQPYRNRVCGADCSLMPQGNGKLLSGKISNYYPGAVHLITNNKDTDDDSDKPTSKPLPSLGILLDTFATDFWNDGFQLFCTACSRCTAGQGDNGVAGVKCSLFHDTICGRCSDGKNYNDGTTRECRPCSTGPCGVGQGEYLGCKINSDRKCAQCLDGQWNDGKVPVCLPCRKTCPAGYGQESSCTAMADGVCTPCDTGYWNDGSFLFCQKCDKTCDRGLGIDRPIGGYECTAYENVICGGYCDDLGKFFNDGNLLNCQQCAACPSGKGDNGRGGKKCTAEMDSVCGMCDEGTNWNDGLTPECRPCTSGTCSMGTGENYGSSCNPKADRTCGACIKGTFNDGRYSDCKRCKTSCPEGTEMSKECSDISDMVCSATLGGDLLKTAGMSDSVMYSLIGIGAVFVVGGSGYFARKSFNKAAEQSKSRTVSMSINTPLMAAPNSHMVRPENDWVPQRQE
eukprot:gb/GEZN01002197.1/.p1 GENE.gb/GEZN01002197.1/~~gb/GEZN01002197.1/.p1  ORF type:complete len:738 (+),score=43.51 gb/GEZN01002197.1/:245-2215(+)